MTNGNRPGPLAEYWPLFIEGILKDVAFLPAIMSINSFGLFIGIIIYILDIFSLIFSLIYLHNPKLLITFIATTLVTGGSRHG